MKYFLYLFFFFYKIISFPQIKDFLNCSSINSEYNCDFCNEKDTYCHCFWKNNKCETNEIKLNEKKWILNFNENYDKQNINETKKYCGEIPKNIKENIFIIPNQINGKYGKKNEIIYCKYRTKVDIEISYFRISKFVFIRYPINNYHPEIFLKVNTKENPIQIVNFTKYKYYKGLYFNTYYEIYVKLDDQYNINPFKIDLTFYSYDQIRAIISLLTLIIVFIVIFIIICFVYFINKIKRKNLLNLLNNKQIYDKNLEKYGNHCSICLGNINIGVEVSLTNCKHVFHYLCFYSWVNNKNNNRNTKCPLCNISLFSKRKNNNNYNNSENNNNNDNNYNINSINQNTSNSLNPVNNE